MAKRLEGRAALVTGAASGIGRAAALVFASEGAKVLLSDVDEAGGELNAKRIREGGGEGLFFRCDVSKAAEVEAMVRKAVSTFGRLDCAFNNAGVEGAPSSTVECSEDNWRRTLDINLKGIWLCMKYEIPEMLKGGRGAIVNNASIAGLVGFPALPAYTASKHGVIGLTRTAALEYAKAGIRVNAVCPGVIQTPMVERFTKGDPKAYAQLAAGEPAARLGKPEEVAEAALFLCTDAASFITGHALAVDGGWVAQ